MFFEESFVGFEVVVFLSAYVEAFAEVEFDFDFEVRHVFDFVEEGAVDLVVGLFGVDGVDGQLDLVVDAADVVVLEVSGLVLSFLSLLSAGDDVSILFFKHFEEKNYRSIQSISY